MKTLPLLLSLLALPAMASLPEAPRVRPAYDRESDRFGIEVREQDIGDVNLFPQGSTDLVHWETLDESTDFEVIAAGENVVYWQLRALSDPDVFSFLRLLVEARTAPNRALPGRILADDFSTLQDAVDALGEEGGVILLSGRTYELRKPLQIRGKTAFQGVMDAGDAFPSTRISPAPGFTGQWLIETVSRDATGNADLNADFGFYDLVMTGTPEIGGIRATNVSVLRIERCRLISMFRCLEVRPQTALPRPYPASVVPGGVFISNSILQAEDICLNLEFSNQNRIYANWFVSESSVALRLMNANKTWFVGNEVNRFKRAAIVLEDDGGGGNYVRNVIVSANWMHTDRSDAAFIEIVNGEQMDDILVLDNVMQGPAGIDLPLQNGRLGNLFRGNGGDGNTTEASGTAIIPAGEDNARIFHGLIGAPAHVSVTAQGRASGYWVESVDEDSFDLFTEELAASDVSFTWKAAVQR